MGKNAERPRDHGEEAEAAYLRAAELATAGPERRFLRRRIEEMRQDARWPT